MSELFRRRDHVPVLWRVLPGLTRYADAIAAMHGAEAELIGGGREQVWLLESPAGFNPGAASKMGDVDIAVGVPIEAVPGRSRAGNWSYHGPGVRGVIVMLDLRARRRDSAGFVAEICGWIIAALAEIGVAARREDQAVDPAGVYIGNDKIAAMGFRLASWVTSYGFALYVDPALANFAGIAPCGIRGRGITSLKTLGVTATMAEVDAALRKTFEPVFGATSLVQ
jgi:lipoyl(octanoyl) transferase